MNVSLAASRIVGFGRSAPARRVRNADIEARLGLGDGWIERRTGIRARHYAADDEAVTDLVQAHTERRIGTAATEDPGIIQRYGWASPSVLSTLGFRRLLSRRGDIPRQDRAAG